MIVLPLQYGFRRKKKVSGIDDNLIIAAFTSAQMFIYYKNAMGHK